MSERPTEEPYRIAVEAAPCGALLVDDDGLIVLANDHAAQMFESTIEGLVGLRVEALVPEEFRPGHDDLRRGFRDAPSTRVMGSGRDLWGLTSAGRRFPLEVSLRPVPGFTLAMVVDLTARKLEQARFRTALDAAPNAILMADADGTIVLCNQHTERVFGYSNGTLVGRPIEALLPPEHAERHRAHRRGYARAPTPREMGAGRELQACREDGSRFPVEVALQPVTMDDGPYVIASVVDISVRVETQRVLESQYAELEERNREIRALARSTSHDLKGPLTTIAGLASSMLDDLEAGSTEELPRVAAWTRRLAKRTAASLERLREIADATTDRHPSSEFELAGCVADVVSELEGLRAAADIELRLDVPRGLKLRTERPRVSSILHNLIRNALDYHDVREADRWVEVTAEPTPGGVRLAVRDNGIGIPDDMRDRVFELFERARTQEDSGAGIGLALVRRHVRQLHGQIQLLPNRPTTFVVELPFTPAP